MTGNTLDSDNDSGEGTLNGSNQGWKMIRITYDHNYGGGNATFMVPVEWGKKDFLEAIEKTIERLAEKNGVLHEHRGKIRAEMDFTMYGYHGNGFNERYGQLNLVQDPFEYELRLVEGNIISFYRALTGENELEIQIDGARRIK